MKRNSFLFLTLTASVFSSALFAQTNPLQQKLDSIVRTKKADVGFSVLYLENQKVVSVNGDKHYPMQSVYKFHLALAVLNQVDQGKFSIDQKILVKPSDLLQDTWSPIRDKYPNGNVELPLSEILKYTVSESDNNGCDILFRLIGGTGKAHQFIKKQGIKEISITGTEEEMHKDDQVQFRNWTTPKAANQLLKKFWEGKVLKKATGDFLMKIMEETVTGPGKIKGLLPQGTVVAHKTGNSGVNKAGIISGSNDIGIVTLPNGKKMLISAFVSMTKEDDKEVDKIIAELAKAAFDEAVK
ncbi:class A beta-lactamase, subclass A2 [Pedobacter caeni]|uniref:Beta-lactamase n=1 Tax=Pedobacter caeni TaxID=288992 RepID=A0A1M4VLZ6_9SPHI|nr:class A beta-lactamase, subclass A2 [Pedobacter caeni]SHE69862.1 beta-lactamase class A [Pedobacter caeni]